MVSQASCGGRLPVAGWVSSERFKRSLQRVHNCTTITPVCRGQTSLPSSLSTKLENTKLVVSNQYYRIKNFPNTTVPKRWMVYTVKKSLIFFIKVYIFCTRNMHGGLWKLAIHHMPTQISLCIPIRLIRDNPHVVVSYQLILCLLNPPRLIQNSWRRRSSLFWTAITP